MDPLVLQKLVEELARALLAVDPAGAHDVRPAAEAEARTEIGRLAGLRDLDSDARDFRGPIDPEPTLHQPRLFGGAEGVSVRQAEDAVEDREMDRRLIVRRRSEDDRS